jgi:two-component system, sensor histidine kinase and response regulator
MTPKRWHLWRWWKQRVLDPRTVADAVPSLAIPTDVVRADIDERYKEALAGREKALAAVHAKTAFLSNMSHELRSPMNAMLGMAELLTETPLNDEQRRYLGVIVNSGNTVLDLVDDILDFARAESGHLKLEAAEFNFIELVEGIAETAAPQAHRKGLELSVMIATGVQTIAIGDRRRLEQVLTNMVGNAVKFTTAGEVAIVAEREPGAPGMVRLSVIDTGIGIEASEHELIFASYAQAATRPADPPGSGLGLAIVKQLTELMGGRVWVDSAPGAGSRFHCSVRLGYRPRGNQADEYALRRSLAGRKVLLIGGMEHNRAALAAILTSCGTAVEEFHPKDEPAIVAAATQADAVLVDMPAAEGASASMVKALTALRKSIALPMIALIPVHNRVLWLSRLRDLGLPYFVIKPGRRAELSSVIVEALSGAEPMEYSSHGPRSGPADSEVQAQRLPPMRILIADDAEDNRILIEAYLRKSACQLDMAGSGSEAIEHFKQRHYDVVLMDLHMPETDGYEAIRQMRAWEHEQGLRRTPIIALTAAVLEDAVRQSLEAGCDNHLSKPVKRSTLFSILQEAAAPLKQAGFG